MTDQQIRDQFARAGIYEVPDEVISECRRLSVCTVHSLPALVDHTIRICYALRPSAKQLLQDLK